MKRLFLAICAITLSTFVFAQDASKFNVLLTGASFAADENGWFELGCKNLGVNAWNKAIGGEAIANTANRMADGTLYSPEEFDDIDAFVIMQVHNKDVFDEAQLKHKYTDYNLPFDRSNYAAAYDYVIKRYITDCYNQKDNPKSKYYGSLYGKPAVIVLCTDWHDARVAYNSSIRKLADKWGFPLVKFDEYIGFSKNQVHPVTGEQVSVMYSINMTNKQTIDGVAYGWHPEKGQDKYIQQRMASIFAEEMRNVLPTK